MTNQAVPLFVPRAVRPRSVPEAQQFAILPARRDDKRLSLAIARIDHSGRVGDRWLLETLGWHPEDAYDLVVLADGVVVSLETTGRFRLNARRHVFVPAATRQILGIQAGDRLLLVACEQQSTLTIHPSSMVADLLFRHYAVAQEALRVR